MPDNIPNITKDLLISFTKFVLDWNGIHTDIKEATWDTMYHQFTKVKKGYGMIFLNWKVANFYGVEPEVLFTKSRKREIVLPRQIAVYFMREFHHNLNAIKRFYGYKQHSTVINAVKVVSNLIETDPKFRKMMGNLMDELL